MRQYPQVLILGRPNVGKSSLFNRLAGRRQALVKDEPGVTRDVLIASTELWGKSFQIIDTGGLTRSNSGFSSAMWEAAQNLIPQVDLVLLVFDGRAGLQADDEEIYRWIKKSGKPMIILVNKLDHLEEWPMLLAEFQKFTDPLLGISLEHRIGLTSFLETLHAFLPEVKVTDSTRPKIAFVGKPNVGKSSLINRILGYQRVLVSPLAGTTIDPVEIPFEWKGLPLCLIDTAGIRATARSSSDLERLASIKSKQAIEMADLLLLVMDAITGPTTQDAKLLDLILENHKLVLGIFNKVDAKESLPFPILEEKSKTTFHFFPDLRWVGVSALTGKGTERLFSKIKETMEKGKSHIPTPKLNEFLTHVIRQAPSPIYQNRDVKIFYLTQTHQEPPTFVAYANYPEGVDTSYRRFLVKKIQEEFDLKGIPIRLVVLPKDGSQS